jgi:hypothetical protein
MKNVKHLLPQVARYFKTNLHTHSTVSDGKLTPAELKEAYIALGYQVLSLTDHNVIVDYSDMNEPDFLFLTGIEVEFNHPEYVSGSDRPVYHLNLIAKQHDNLWAPGKVTGKFPNAAPFEEKMQCENMDMSYNPEAVNAMIAKANEKGFLVTYNHPTWSCQSYPDYAPLKNVWGMEVRNSECCSLGNNDNNERVFKDLLNLGNRILPLGSDDTHKREAIGGAWIMVGAEKLTYDSVIEALEKGDLYMSCGPEISDISMEGNMLKITCSDAKRITLETHGRYAKISNADGENWLNEAQFDLTDFILRANGDNNAYVRLTVTAPDGTYACSRAYYLNEL